ncbi:MAG: hypothetical protein Q7U56_13705 [Humidesulfovibrio sp.]|nr:hypothetical protein [Desulfovibrio sp.]MDO9084326.1 hypothetical protein [Humidesulfovibrio sp.]
MPIDRWLSGLSQHDHASVDGDLEALTRPHPFLTEQRACTQIESLSGHLGGLKQVVRRQVIAYSLYIRQLDTVLESGPRATCGSNCPRPPVGCCNDDHFVTLSAMDLMSAQHSPMALHMAHIIGGLQQNESAHSLRQGQRLKPGHCRCLAEDGCTIRLFKSPRCAHYLCNEVGQAMQDQHTGSATAFLAAMHYTVSSPISSPRDFTNPNVLSEAAALFNPLPDGTAPLLPKSPA